MNLIIYISIGIVTAMIGALPLGTTNVAVINTTIKENVKSAMKLVYTAALAEVILVIIAICFNMQIEKFIGMNIWVQYTIAGILVIVGIILLVGRKECVKGKDEDCNLIKERFNMSKEVLGFILGVINPAVLAYWIFMISFLNKKMIHLNVNTSYTLLGLFIIGVFIGKVLTLYGYGRFSHILKVKVNNITTKVNRVIGVLLVCISFFQVTKLFYF